MKHESDREWIRTVRQQIIDSLTLAELTAREVSQLFGISENEVYGHLEHIAKSVKTDGRKLRVNPCHCLDCHFEFSDRKRLTKPGRCPQCRGSHIGIASFSIS